MAKRKSTSHSTGQYKDLIEKCFIRQRNLLGRKSNLPIPSFEYYSANVAQELKRLYHDVDMDYGRKEQARYDYTAQKTKLREKGTVKYIPIAEKELTGIMQRKDIPVFMFFANSRIGGGGYDAMDQEHRMTAAATVWILDQLMLQKKHEELYPILLSVDIPGALLETPLFEHPVHPRILIDQLTLLIIHRNDGLYDPSPIPTPWADEWTLTPVQERKSTEGFPLRHAFERVMALIDPTAIAEATKRFEKKVWDFYRLAAAAETQCNNELRQLKYQKEYLLKQQSTLGSRPPATAILDVSFLRNDPVQSAELNRIQQRIDRIDLAQSSLFTSIILSNNREKDLAPLEGVISDDVLQRLIQFDVGDPFETAFAFLALLDSGSMLPWAYYGSLSVFCNALDQLPFHAYPGLPTFQVIPGRPLPEDAYSLRYPYKRWHNTTDAEKMPVQRQFGMNLGQIIYRCTGSILPRLSSTCDILAKHDGVKTTTNDPSELLATFGLDTDKERFLAYVLIDLLNSKWLALQHSYHQPESLVTEANSEISKDETTTNDIECLEEYRKEIQRLKSELRNANALLHQTELKEREERKKTSVQEDEIHRLRLELHDLRTIVFQQNNNHSEEPANAQLTFPIAVTKRIVAYGGHPTWLNRIRALLPDVRFIPADIQPHIDLFQHAEEIWIQPNCLSHSAFYKLADYARSKRIPMRYFSYSSAEKCAEQLVYTQK